MSGYEGLAPYYHALFPVSDALKRFLRPWMDTARSSRRGWLDVGCGTGALVEWLLEQGVAATGIDPETEFVREANRRIGAAPMVVSRGALADIARFAAPGSLDVVTCLGNSLAHAADRGEIDAFFHDSAALLAPEGAAIVQTVNFDRVRSDPDWIFPVLERSAPDGTPLRFERKYEAAEARPGGAIRFTTKLRAGDREIQGAVNLFAMSRAELESAARKHFSKTEISGDFTGAAWAHGSPATILTARRPLWANPPAP